MKSSPIVSLVVAVAENGVIGRNGDLPWRLSGDLQRFKRLTMGHCLILGRRTYESIGRPLPGRVSIVLSRQPAWKAGHPEVLVARDWEGALASVATSGMATEEVFVVGGAEIYRQALPHAGRLYRTLVHASPTGDVQLPEIDFTEWHCQQSETYPADERNEFACTWEQWARLL